MERTLTVVSALARVPEAATYLNVSRGFLYKEINAGRIPVRRIGSNIRIPWKWLREQVEAQEESEENKAQP